MTIKKYDFGKFGIWSKKEMKQNPKIRLEYQGNFVFIIEKIEKQFEEFAAGYSFVFSKPLKNMVMCDLRLHSKVYDEYDQICEDYKKYRRLMRELFKKEYKTKDWDKYYKSEKNE